MAGVGDTVMVVMHHPENHVIAWDGRQYKLTKDKEAFMPFEVAANYFGDPRATTVMLSTQDHRRRVGWVPDRASEVRRLRVLYGIQHGDTESVYLPSGLMEMLGEDIDQKQKRHWLKIDARIPRVEVYDLETRERLYTVLEDPLGDHVTPAERTRSVEERQAARIEKLEEMVQMLLEQQRGPNGLVVPGMAAAGDPNSPPREVTAAERAMAGPLTEEEFGEEPGLGEPDDLEHIESRRSGSAGLPADRG